MTTTNEFTPRKATRQGVKPLIGLFSESGCGKTMSALLLARGFVGPSGKIGMIDTESGRGSLYADVIPGGYDVIELREPFSPARYIQAIHALREAGCAIGLIDSASHAWEGLGGVLDMAGDNEQRTGKAGLHNWKTPKMEHAKMMLAMLQSPLPLIVCLRAKHKTRQLKVNGRTEIVKDDFTTPIQSDDFIFEMTAHGEIMPDHAFRLTKCSHPALRECFPVKGPITIQHGEALAAWCNSGGKTAAAPAKSERKRLMVDLMAATETVHRCPKDGDMIQKTAAVQRVERWLWDEGLLDPDAETLSGVSDERLIAVTKAAGDKLKGGVQ